MTSRYQALLYSLLFLSIVGGGSAYIENFDLRNIFSGYLLIQSFGFLKDGYLQVNDITVRTTPSNGTVWLLLCDKDEFNKHFRRSLTNPECTSIDEDFCELSLRLHDEEPLKMRYNVTKGGYYYMIFAECDDSTFYSAHLDYALLNPGGENLSTDSIPFPVLYMVLLVTWFIVLGLWCFNWIKNRRQHIKLHAVISIFPAFKFLFCCAAVYYWKYLSMKGADSTTTVVVYEVLYIGFEVVFYCVLLTIASGWGISRDTMGSDIWVIIIVAIGLCLAEVASYFLKSYFSLLIMICYVVIIITIFKSTNRNMSAIGSEMSEAEEEAGPRRRNISAEKFKMFRTFKAIMLSYLVAVMLILLTTVLFLQYFPWIYNMLNELLQLVMFICIGWTFRLRDVNIYYRIPNAEEDPSWTSDRPSSPVVELSTIQEAPVDRS